MMPDTGVVYDPIYLKHDTGNHPENWRRLEAVDQHFKETGYWSQLIRLSPRRAEREDLLRVHTAAHLDHIEQICQQGGGYLNLDTPVSAESYEVALMAAGGVLRGIDAIMEGEVKKAVALVRPPGHHATSNQALGFCLFNNVAAGASYLQQMYGLESILILDWDLHHGNGTQDIFYQQSGIYFFSLHQKDFYPFSGYEKETGEGEGKDWTLNYPLPAGTSREDYRQAFSAGLKEALKFNPQFILISAGFDAHRDDPLGSLSLIEEDYLWMTEEIRKEGEDFCQGRILSVLEGGYDLRVLSHSLTAHIKGLSDER